MPDDRQQSAEHASTISAAPMVPIDPSVNTWTRFITTFEPSEYTTWIDESVSWKTTCYIGDWSPLLKLRVRGPEAKAFFEYLSTNHWPDFRVHQAKHAIFCREDGKIVGEGVIMMLGHEDLIFTSVPGVTWALYQFYHGARKFNATIEVVSDEWYLFQVQGPKSVEIMEEVTGSPVTDLKFMNAKELAIDGSKFLCLRQGVSGERGFELWGPAREGRKVYSAIVESGAKFGIRQLGGRAKPVNHVEGAFPTPGLDFLPAVHGNDPELRSYHEFLQAGNLVHVSFLHLGANGNYSTDPPAHHRTPYDLGWGWLVNFEHDFIGKDALKAIADDPPNALVTLEWNSEDVIDVYTSLFRADTLEYMELPRNAGGSVTGSRVCVNDAVVGCAVSRCYSYWFKKMISLCIIEKEHAVLGTEVLVLWGKENEPQKLIRAIVKPAPYKEDQRKKSLKS
ncbi:glycine cleavage T protein [Paraphoma chrysanthemicola]|uniref:Glycine cleavage T protein n=1 Tax=Paraphoma chrysanthemicola TaxID=798071 RepID=A0A8K0QWU2_9PLEO|nr:glycine cleavage T protein [Paraphoma chrysanthemicola]